MSVFSLPTQRCFQLVRDAKAIRDLFSAYAEVFLKYSKVSGASRAFLCLRRGVSRTPCRGDSRNLLFSAYAEVFLRLLAASGIELTFLCLRRGVSQHETVFGIESAFSLPTQRCFLLDPDQKIRLWLFSAYAEVFPEQIRGCRLWFAFLCLRRGVSRSSTPNAMIRSFSLPTQRCFFLSISEGWERSLFSAYAEVFL